MYFNPFLLEYNHVPFECFIVLIYIVKRFELACQKRRSRNKIIIIITSVLIYPVKIKSTEFMCYMKVSKQRWNHLTQFTVLRNAVFRSR